MKRIKPGQRFGKWTTLHTTRYIRPSGRVVSVWIVVCDCGEQGTAAAYDLNQGKTTQCRRCYGSIPADLIDKKFGFWTVLREGETKNKKNHWICICSCGNECNVCGASLINGVSTKCIECYHKEMPEHGLCGHPLYSIWSGMISRCEDKNHISYRYYGARGITVCDRWKNLELFFEDMGERPKRTSIDRIDNNGNYEPLNCRWSTTKVQARNTRSNRIIEHDGMKKCVSEWAEYFGINPPALFTYLKRNTFEKAYEFYRSKDGSIHKE